MDEEYLSLKKWLEDTRDVPLEAMDAFFNARIGQIHLLVQTNLAVPVTLHL